MSKLEAIPSTIQDMPGHWIRRLQQAAAATVGRDLVTAGFDITAMQYAVLQTISDHPGIDQSSVAGCLYIDRATIGGVIDRLTRKGYVNREVSPSDRRARILSLTESGVETLGQTKVIVSRAQSLLLKALKEDERAQFFDMLMRVVTDLNQPEAPNK